MSADHPSELSWNLDDYKERGEEPPDIILANSDSCEGQLMTDEEVDQYVADAVATLKVLQDKGSDRFEAVHSDFIADLDFLVSIGRIDPEIYVEMSKLETFEF